RQHRDVLPLLPRPYPQGGAGPQACSRRRRRWAGVDRAAGTGHVCRGPSPGTDAVYGAFATVLVLLAWISFSMEITVYAAELNVVLVRRLVAPLHRPAAAHRG